uniref:Neuropeptide n=1 Tax=Haemonchus contortus TaxID=6289 RepID=A0A7I4YIR1_HAECO
MEMFHAIILALLATAVYAQIGRYSRYRRAYPQPEPLPEYFDDSVESAKVKEDLLRFLESKRYNDLLNDEEELDRMVEDLDRFFERKRFNDRPEPDFLNDEIGRYSRYRRSHPQPEPEYFDDSKVMARVDEYFRRHPQREPLNDYPQPDDSIYNDALESLQERLLEILDRGHFKDKARLEENLLRYFDRAFLSPSSLKEKELLDELQEQLGQIPEWERMNGR